MRPERSRVQVMMSSPAAFASLAYCEGTIFPARFTASNAHIGGATILMPCDAYDFSSAAPGSSASALASSRYTACLPNCGSFSIQYRMSSLLNDWAQTLRGDTPASL